MIDTSDIRAAQDRIAGYVRVTPIIEAEENAFGSHPPINLKLEFLQKSGAFKARGAFNNLLSREIPQAGVAAASGGNHGAAVSLAAKTLGVPATIFVPEISSPSKIARIRANGAEVVIKGATYADALIECQAFMKASGAIDVHAYDAPETLAGQGTVAAEWMAQAPDLDTLMIAVGGGGLIGGIAAWVGPDVRLIAVESDGTATLHSALAAGEPTNIAVSGIAADSLGAKRIGTGCFDILSRATVTSVLVTDAAIRAAQIELWKRMRVPSEPGGATALAALLCGAYRPRQGERIGVLVCGANGAVSDFA